MNLLRLGALAASCAVLALSATESAEGLVVGTALTTMPDADVNNTVETAVDRVRGETHLLNIVVKGQREIVATSLIVDRLLFVGDGTLVVTPPTQRSDAPIVLVVGEIVYTDGTADTVGRVRHNAIEWRYSSGAGTEAEHVTEPRSNSAEAGEAGVGFAGQDGSTGAPGLPGLSAIFVLKKVTLPLPLLIARGQNGGDGGPGQPGGPGANGRNGESSSQSLFECRRSAKDGEPGAPGGAGGKGGDGGSGGTGGNLKVLLPKDVDVNQLVGWSLDVSGGGGGHGGPGGAGGEGGGPGLRGTSAAPFCTGGAHDGARGPNGFAGPVGAPGLPGNEGSASIGLIEASTFLRLGLAETSFLKRFWPFGSGS